MKTPKPSAGSGLVRRSGSPGAAPELLPASAPGRGKSRKDLPPDGPAEKALEGRVIKIRGAREHNLKNIDLTIPRDKLVVFTGLSGSGKSSLAFDTIYAEGQRRYVESLSAYARQFLEMMQKPDVDQIDVFQIVLARAADSYHAALEQTFERRAGRRAGARVRFWLLHRSNRNGRSTARESGPPDATFCPNVAGRFAFAMNPR